VFFLRGAPELTRREWTVLGLVSLASLFDQYDRCLIVMALPQIQAGLGIAEGQLGLLASVIRLGALPAIGIALLADRVGRRRALLFSVLAYTALTGATALAPNPQAFLALQFLARSFGAAEMLLAIVVISEELGPGKRGWGTGAFLSIQACGVGLAALLLPIASQFAQGWRALYLVGLGPLLVLAWLRRSLPETERFTAHQRARESLNLGGSFFAPLARLVRAYPRRFAACSIEIVCMGIGYSAADFLGPKYLEQAHGWTPGQVSLLFLTGGLVGIIGAPVAGALSDRLGRRPVGALGTLALCASALLYFNLSGFLLVPLWIAGVFAVTGREAVLGALGAELFPTSHRSTASAARLIVGTVSGAAGLALESLLYRFTGSHWSAVSLLLVMVAGSPLVVALFFPETAGRSLEEISPEHDLLERRPT
jgi:MFS family permease